MSASVFITALTVLTLVFAAAPAIADEIQLQNGDRITGKVTGLAGGMLTFKTPGGDLNIPWNTVTSIASTETLRVRIAKRRGTQTITGMSMAVPGQILLIPGGPVTFTELTDLGPIEKAVTINGGTSAGFLNSGGNSEVFSLRLDGEFVLRQSANRYSLAAAVNRVRNRLLNLDTSRNWNTGLNYDRFLTRRLFLNANTIFTNDEFRDLHLRTAFGLGVGYQVIDRAVVKLTANTGFGWVNEDFFTTADNDYTAARESASLDISAIPHRIEFFHKHDGYFGLAGDDNLFIKTHQGVRVTVINNFVTTLQYDLDYDGSPSPGLKATDRTFALTFGYRF
jgi:putative salt-induced outer membrane protein YdiY